MASSSVLFSKLGSFNPFESPTFLANYAELKNLKYEEERRDKLLKEGNFLPMKQPDCDSPQLRNSDSEEENEGDAEFSDEEETKAQMVNSSQTKSL